MKRRTLYSLRVAVAGLSVLLALGGLELLLRLRPVHEQVRASAIRVRGMPPPGMPEFRPPRSQLGKPPGVFRILVVGDSYTFGDGVYAEDAYPQRLEARLRESYPAWRVEVLPWARRGWNTQQQLSSVTPYFDQLSPDLILIGFTLNDTEPSSIHLRETLRQKVLPRSAPPGFPGWTTSKSLLLQSLWTSYENARVRRELAVYYRKLHSEDSAFEKCRRALKGFKRLARRRSIPLVAFIFPIFDSQLDHRYRYREVHGIILDRLQELGISVFDLLPSYEGLDTRRLAVTPFTNPHPNELAHRIAADAVLEALLERGVLQPETTPAPGQALPSPTQGNPE